MLIRANGKLFDTSKMRTIDQCRYLAPSERFDAAIAAGHLSADPHATNYAGHFMYMGTYPDADAFKHIDTREYSYFSL